MRLHPALEWASISSIGCPGNRRRYRMTRRVPAPSRCTAEVFAAFAERVGLPVVSTLPISSHWPHSISGGRAIASYTFGGQIVRSSGYLRSPPSIVSPDDRRLSCGSIQVPCHHTETGHGALSACELTRPVSEFAT